MSILIKGMEMPRCCDDCPFCVPEADEENGDICIVSGQFPIVNKDERSVECPLLELPPHGRLINADAFIAEKRKQFCEDCDRRKGFENGKHTETIYEIGGAPCRACDIDDMLDFIDDAPTIIEAEGVE